MSLILGPGMGSDDLFGPTDSLNRFPQGPELRLRNGHAILLAIQIPLMTIQGFNQAAHFSPDQSPNSKMS